ncbi:MAG: GNAT family N-acetyltransferase [Solirubrobacteraceae bacterium]
MPERVTGSALIEIAERHLDAAPRFSADAVDAGAFTLFVSRTAWSYYARPSLGSGRPITGADLAILAATCAERGVGLDIEWVRETRPELELLAREYGLLVQARALLAAAPARIHAVAAEGVTIRIAGHDDPGLPSARAVAEVSFGFGGTAAGTAGVAERDEVGASLAPELIAHLRRRAELGLNVTALAETQLEGVVATGSYQPIETTAEVVSVATLPCARRRGIAAALTAALARDALGRGVETLLLSATDDDVARLYERLGFRRIGVAFEAHAAT